MSMSGEYQAPYREPVSGWVGWIVFAAVFMITVGALNAIQGLAALFRDDAFWVLGNGSVVTFNITTWGWIHLLMGAAADPRRRAADAGLGVRRVAGIVLVALNMMAQFGFATLYPFWSLIAIAIDVAIIYALVVHGGDIKRSA